MKPFYRKLLYYSGTSLLTLLLMGALTGLVAYAWLTPRLPSIDTLKDVRLQVPLRVYARDGALIAEFGEMKRSPLSYEEFPTELVKALLAAEDDRFFEHPGVDYKGILRASFKLITTGRRAQGGSTITMQVARNFFLSRERTFLRKFNEILLALKIENELTKQQILELYLNKIYLGKRAYGFAAAAQVYYGKDLGELELHQLAMIAGLPKAPSTFNPIVNPERALQRRNYILGRMRELGFIDEERYAIAVAAADDAAVHALDAEVEAPYVAEMVRAEMLERFGDEAYTLGYRVYTTIDPRRQAIANRALRNALLAYGRRHGYRGVVRHVELFDNDELGDMQGWDGLLADVPVAGDLEAAVVFQVDEDAAWAYTSEGRISHLPFEERLKWARAYHDDNHRGPEPAGVSDVLKVGDIILVQPGAGNTACSWLAEIPEVAGALTSLDPTDGSIRALVGGFDFYRSKFNRVTQARRQPGSSFKPIIYTAALNKGFTAASIINDAPVVFDAPGLEDTWRPENYTGRFYGPTRLRKALINSRNLVSIRLLRDIGIGYAVRFARRFGFSPSNLPRDLSLALGSGSVTPLDMAAAYAVFANGGYRVQPWYISHIVGPDGRIVARTLPNRVCPDCLAPTPTAALVAAVVPTDEAAVAENADGDGLAAAPETGVGDDAGPAEAPTETAAEPSAEPRMEPLQELDIYPELTAGELVSVPELAVPVAGEEPEEAVPTPPADVESAAIAAVAETPRVPLPPMFLPARQVLPPQTAFLMNTMLRDVIRRGTGRRAMQLGRHDLGGKTGTTNDQQDAWFSGFNGRLVAITWVGFDDPRPLGDRETGARAALPMWMEYMGGALQGVPETPLEQPPGLVSVRIDAETGQLASPDSRQTLFEYFLADQVPTETTTALPTPDDQPDNGGDITEQLF